MVAHNSISQEEARAHYGRGTFPTFCWKTLDRFPTVAATGAFRTVEKLGMRRGKLLQARVRFVRRGRASLPSCTLSLPPTRFAAGGAYWLREKARCRANSAVRARICLFHCPEHSLLAGASLARCAGAGVPGADLAPVANLNQKAPLRGCFFMHRTFMCLSPVARRCHHQTRQHAR